MSALSEGLTREKRPMRWALSHRFDKRALPLADRHYNRRKVGSPQFVPPGRCVVLLTECERALWVTSAPFAEYVKHRWPGAWVNSLFRNEGVEGAKSSDLIRDALAATVATWGPPPPQGCVTFVDRGKVRRKRDFGRCYRKAGFVPDGETQGGLVALHLAPEAFPPPRAPLGAQATLDSALAALGVDRG